MTTGSPAPAHEAAGTEFGVGKELSTDSLLGGVIALFAVPAGSCWPSS